MGESTKAGDAVDKLGRAPNGKFNGIKLDVGKRTAQSVISVRHAGISDILEGRFCPEPKLVSPRPSSRRSRPSRAVTRSQAAVEADIQSGETTQLIRQKMHSRTPGILPRTRRICHHHLQDIPLPSRNIRFMGQR